MFYLLVTLCATAEPLTCTKMMARNPFETEQACFEASDELLTSPEFLSLLQDAGAKGYTSYCLTPEQLDSLGFTPNKRDI